MEILNNLIQFFQLGGLAQDATFVDLLLYVIHLYFAVYIVITIYRGVITFASKIGKPV